MRPDRSQATSSSRPVMLANIYNRRSDYLAALGELDAYLRLTPDGALSDQVRLVQESLKRKLARSVVIVAAARVRESREPAPHMGRVSSVQTSQAGELFPIQALTNHFPTSSH